MPVKRILHNKRTVANDTARAHNKALAVELRVKHWSQADIARQLGVNQSTVSRWLDEALVADQKRLEELAPLLRAQEDARYDWLGKRLMAWIEDADADGPNTQAAAALIQLFARRSKMHGLDAPVKTEDVTPGVYLRQVRVVRTMPSQLPEASIGETHTHEEQQL